MDNNYPVSNQATFDTNTERGKKNIFMAVSAGLATLTLWDKPRQWLKQAVGMYETVHYVDPDATTTEETTTV